MAVTGEGARLSADAPLGLLATLLLHARDHPPIAISQQAPELHADPAAACMLPPGLLAGPGHGWSPFHWYDLALDLALTCSHEWLYQRPQFANLPNFETTGREVSMGMALDVKGEMPHMTSCMLTARRVVAKLG